MLSTIKCIFFYLNLNVHSNNNIKQQKLNFVEHLLNIMQTGMNLFHKNVKTFPSISKKKISLLPCYERTFYELF